MGGLPILLAAGIAAAALLMAGCGSAAPAPTPTKAPAAAPTKVVEPTKAAAPAASTAAPAAPTKAPEPAKKVDWPQRGKAVQIIVPYPAGGGSDLSARPLAPPLEKELGTPVEVVNKGGAGGQVGLTELVKSKADGYTIGYTLVPPIITTYMDPRRQAVFAKKDFAPLALQGMDVATIAVRSDGPWKTLKDLIDAAKAKPESIRGGTTGIGSTAHLNILQTEKVSGAKFATVHFDGDAAIVTALLGGHIEAYFSTQANLLPHIKSGALRLLAVMDKEPSPFYPEGKTAEAQGYKVYVASSRGLSAPAGTPKEVLDILSAGIKKAIESDEHKNRMKELGLLVRYMSPADFAAYWTETEGWVEPLMPALIAAG